MKQSIHQIYYDELTRAELDTGFLPLSNVSSDHPEWFEFWPILKYLNEHELEQDRWYGFLSPKFIRKTGVNSNLLFQTLKENNDQEVILISPAWDQVAYFSNVFEQGEFWHPGLMGLTQKFIDQLNLDIFAHELVMDGATSVFSNFILAKKNFWMQWKEIAQLFFEFSNRNKEYAQKMNGIYDQYQIKVFIQERLASLILHQSNFKTINFDDSEFGPINNLLFENDLKTRELLKKCNAMKSGYRKTKDAQFIDEYWKARNQISIKKWIK